MNIPGSICHYHEYEEYFDKAEGHVIHVHIMWQDKETGHACCLWYTYDECFHGFYWLSVLPLGACAHGEHTFRVGVGCRRCGCLCRLFC